MPLSFPLKLAHVSYHAQLASQILKLLLPKCLCEYLCWLGLGRNMKEVQIS